ncbi:MAG: alpha/beta fold hydrolase, partial [Polyangiales bacterium]
MATGVVFIHGMWSQRGVWDRWLPAFAERGYVCDAVTLPAHHAGAHDAELAGVGFEDCVDAAARACARFAHPILIGHSMGGLIAQKLATRLTPRAVVLLNSAAPRAVFPLRSANVRGLSRHFVR